MKLKNKLKMFEEFTSAEKNTETIVDSKGSVTAPSNVTSILNDVDGILGNLETLSKQIDEGQLFEAGGLEEVMKIIASSAAYAKLTSILPKYKKLLQAADTNLIGYQHYQSTKKATQTKIGLDQKIKEAPADMKPKLRAQKEKIQAALDDLEQDLEAKKQQAKDAVDTLKETMGKYEGTVTGKLKELYSADKIKIERDVNVEGLQAKAKQAKDAGKTVRLETAKAELKAEMVKSKEIEDKIKKAQDVSKEDLVQVKGMSPYLNDVDAILQARAITKELGSQTKKLATTLATDSAAESLTTPTHKSLNESVSELEKIIDTAKSNNNNEVLSKAKELAAKYKAAAEAEYNAVKALYDKIQGKEVVKSVITLAGGDDEKAKEGSNGFEIGPLIKKFGGDAGFITPEDFGGIKSSQQILDKIDQAPEPEEEEGKGGEERTAEQIQQEIDDIKQQINDKTDYLDSKREKTENSEAGQEYAKVNSKYDTLRSTPKEERAEDHEDQLQALKDRMDQIEQDYRENDPLGKELTAIESEIKSLKDQYAEKQQELKNLQKESFAFKSGSVADKFRRLL